MSWETVIGLEVHVQLRTSTKMFCACSAEYGAAPNSNVCPVCLGLPGALPVPNDEAVALAARAALALRCEVFQRSEFVRKNYFYPDLPKGYQITQLDHPLALQGVVPITVDGGSAGGADGESESEEREIRIRRLHLEEDSGKSLHDRFPDATAVDLNRAGVPLVEIVTEPDLRSPAGARTFLIRLKQLLEHFAAVSDCNMEEGSLRVDANLSVRPPGRDELGTKTEVKNLNSFSHVEKALALERDRQIGILEEGGTVARETRLFDAVRGETRGMRGKEEDFDYRYFPEPDLPILELPAARITRIREGLPELPRALERRLGAEYGLSAYDAGLLAAYPRRADFFEASVDDRSPEFAKQVANFIMGPIAAELNRREDGTCEDDLLPAGALSRVTDLRLDGTLSSDTADEAIEVLIGEDDPDPDRVIREHGLAQVRDTDQLREWVEEAVAANPEEVARYAGGEEKLIGFFMGAVMRRARGKADPEQARELLLSRLEAATVED